MFISPRIKCLSWLSTKFMAARYTHSTQSIVLEFFMNWLRPNNVCGWLLFISALFLCILAFRFNLSMPFSAWEYIPFSSLSLDTNGQFSPFWIFPTVGNYYVICKKNSSLKIVLMQMHPVCLTGTFLSSVWLVCASNTFNGNQSIWFQLLQKRFHARTL